jgi:hypothetical protein
MVSVKPPRQRCRIVCGGILLAAAAGLVVLSSLGAGKVALGIGLALVFLAWPLAFLPLAPSDKPGLDPVTAKYYHPDSVDDQKPIDPSGHD